MAFSEFSESEEKGEHKENFEYRSNIYSAWKVRKKLTYGGEVVCDITRGFPVWAKIYHRKEEITFLK